VKSEQIAEERKWGGGSERDCTYYGGGGTRLYCPEGSQALPACPSDKNSITMDASVERWWIDDRGKRKYLKRNWYRCHVVHHMSHTVWPRKFWIYLSEAYIAVSRTLVAGLPARSRYPEDPATGHLDTSFLGFPVSKSEY